MKIEKTQNEQNLVIALEGRLDTTTAPQLEEEIKDSLGNITDLVIDLDKLEYISSAGLRVLLSAYRTIRTKGSMKVINANELVQEVFEVTGFADFLQIE